MSLWAYRYCLAAPSLPRPSRSLFNSDHLTTEARNELLSVYLLGEAPDIDPLVIAAERMASIADRQVITEVAQRFFSQRHGFRKRDLYGRPLSI